MTLIKKTTENKFESTQIQIEKIRMRNPNKMIFLEPQDKSIITSREDDIVQMCKLTPNDMELGKKIREYINKHFNQ